MFSYISSILHLSLCNHTDLSEYIKKGFDKSAASREPMQLQNYLFLVLRCSPLSSYQRCCVIFLALIHLIFLGLNSLQSGLHKQQMKDLFVELCLTVPVRLSSLLPYLPMLMDPLVSALNGSQTLVSQVSRGGHTMMGGHIMMVVLGIWKRKKKIWKR